MTSREQAAINLISSTGWLGACAPAFRDWMVANTQWRVYAAGEGLTHAGDTDGAVYCVGDGQVHFVTGIGMADIGTAFFGLPGGWWGHAPLLGGVYIGSAVASADALCRAVRLQALRARLVSHPGDWEQIALAISGQFVMSVGAHADMLIADSRRRVAATILRLGGWRHRRYRISPPPSFVCTQEHLAGACAFSRNTVGKVVRGLETEGLIDTRYGRIAILDAKRLRKVAEAD